MQASLIIYEALAKAIVNHVHVLAELVLPHAEVVRLYISMQVLAVVDKLQQLEHLYAQRECRPHSK